MDKDKELTKDELLELVLNMEETKKNELFKKSVIYDLAGVIGTALCFTVYKTVNIDTSLKELLLLGAMIYCLLLEVKGMTYGLPIVLTEEAKLKKEENKKSSH